MGEGERNCRSETLRGTRTVYGTSNGEASLLDTAAEVRGKGVGASVAQGDRRSGTTTDNP